MAHLLLDIEGMRGLKHNYKAKNEGQRTSSVTCKAVFISSRKKAGKAEAQAQDSIIGIDEFKEG